jgi:hypothetical protein
MLGKAEQELELEFEEEEQPVEVKPENRRVISQPKDYSIFELQRQHERGRLNLQPEFQRFYVWDDTKASRLIESVLLDVPIPTIYLVEESDGSYSVIDGQQRLNSFFRFLRNELRLRGLIVMSELIGKTFKDLPPAFQDKLEKATIHIIVINRESHPDIKFEIFERLNTGAVKLNDQELRNCIYRGEYNKLLEELSEDRDFLFLLGLDRPDKRMRDRELILRFFALYKATHLHYKPPMKSFLNKEMENHKDLAIDEKKEMRELFKKAVQLTKTVFGENAFKRFVAGSDRDPNGQWERKMNKALFDIVMFGFAKYDKHQIVPNSDAIREELIWLMTHDNEFIEAITIGTNDQPRVYTRFQKWINSLQQLLGSPKTEPRAFSRSFKEQLWRANSTCTICGQKIQLPDDAEVDHIDFYWRGGRTIPSNARLTHRYCNRARGGRDRN